jgi:hypothetical protein
VAFADPLEPVDPFVGGESADTARITWVVVPYSS